MPRTSKQSSTVDLDSIVAAVLTAMQDKDETPRVKPQGGRSSKRSGTAAQSRQITRKQAKTREIRNPDAPASRSQVYRCFFLLAREAFGLEYGRDEWPTMGDVQTIIDALG